MVIAPSEKQMRFLNWEFGAFFHFGIRTFYPGHMDWDGKEMDASSFNPQKLDCNQWIKVIKSIGMKYAIMTTKHHDGFALWPSKYTSYSVKSTCWRDGKGDVVKEFVDACRKEDIAVGLYYSPAQWGNQNKAFNSGEYDVDYDNYFINQITELLTNYGKIDYLWFDGCGSGNHKYNQKRIINVIRSLQPEIIIFGMWDPDVSWVGNEDGYAPIDNTGIMTINVLGEQKTVYQPLECDCRIRGRWFYDNDVYSLKSVDELMGMYELSIGRGANLLLNIGPNDDGLLPDFDIARLKEFKGEIDKRYSHPLPMNDFIEEKENVYSIEYSDKVLNVNIHDTDFIPEVRRVVLKEDITDGVRSRRFKLYAHIPSRNPISDRKICVYGGETIGKMAICPVPNIRAPKLTLEILDSEGKTKLTYFKAF